MLLLCSSFRWTRLLLLLCYSFLLYRATSDTLFAENFLSGVCDLLENRLVEEKRSLSIWFCAFQLKTISCMIASKTNCANYLATRLEGLVTFSASEALLMVCVAHCWHNFTLNIFLAHSTFSPKSFLIINDTVVVVVFRKEPTNGQWLLALDALKAAFVEVFVGHPQHFTGTLFLAFSAVNFCFTCGTKNSLNFS